MSWTRPLHKGLERFYIVLWLQRSFSSHWPSWPLLAPLNLSLLTQYAQYSLYTYIWFFGSTLVCDCNNMIESLSRNTYTEMITAGALIAFQMRLHNKTIAINECTVVAREHWQCSEKLDFLCEPEAVFGFSQHGDERFRLTYTLT